MPIISTLHTLDFTISHHCAELPPLAGITFGEYVNRTILQAVIAPRLASLSSPRPDNAVSFLPSERLPQLVMASATLTSGVKSLLNDLNGFRWDLPGKSDRDSESRRHSYMKFSGYLVHTSNTQRVRSSLRVGGSHESKDERDASPRIRLELVEIEGTHK